MRPSPSATRWRPPAASGEEAGWHLDTTYSDPAKTEGSPTSPSYPESVGFNPTHNEHGFLRSPTDHAPARLYDYPGSSRPQIKFDFETVAKGMDSQNVYGGLHWGFEVVGGVPQAEYATAQDTTSTEFDISLQRFRAFFTHEPTVVYFDTNADVPAAGEDAKLDEAIGWMAEFSDAHVEIDGFADETGPAGHNAGLSRRRADSVAAALMAPGTRRRANRPCARRRRNQRLRRRRRGRSAEGQPARAHPLHPQRQHAARAIGRARRFDAPLPIGIDIRRPENPLVIDVEASGFGGTSYPIEVGVALDDGTRYCSLILPSPDWDHWDPDAEKVHRIARDFLKRHGRPVQQVAATLNELLAGKTLYTDGWVVDKPWLTTLFHEARLPMRFSVSPLELILTEPQMDRWHATKARILAAEKDDRHRASFDAWIVQQTYRRTLAETSA